MHHDFKEQTFRVVLMNEVHLRPGSDMIPSERQNEVWGVWGNLTVEAVAKDRWIRSVGGLVGEV